jgi:hypothetical protein
LPALKPEEQYGNLNAGEFKKDLDQIASSATTTFRLLGRTKKGGQAFTPELSEITGGAFCLITNSTPIFHHDFTDEFSLTTQLHWWREHRLLAVPTDDPCINGFLQRVGRSGIGLLDGGEPGNRFAV